MIGKAEKTNNCDAGKKFVTKNYVRRWRLDNRKIISNLTEFIPFRLSKNWFVKEKWSKTSNGRTKKVKIRRIRHRHDMLREIFPVARESLKIKGREIVRNLSISEFKPNTGWYIRTMRWNVVRTEVTHYVIVTTPKEALRKLTALSAPNYTVKRIKCLNYTFGNADQTRAPQMAVN